MSKKLSLVMESVFDALPDAYALIKYTASGFVFENCNAAYYENLGAAKETLIGEKFFELIPSSLEKLSEQDLQHLQEIMHETVNEQQSRSTNILKLDSGKTDNSDIRFLCFSHTPLPFDNEENQYIIQKLEDLSDQLTNWEKKQTNYYQLISRQELYLRNENLEDQINVKIAQYDAANKELNDFIYSVSHDLRAPLRRIDGFSQELINEYMDQLDETGAHYLKRVRQGAQDMGNLIDDLLKLSRISRREVEIETVDISKLAKSVYDELLELEKGREINISIEENLFTEADEGLLKVVLMNLFSNALKFTSKQNQTVIEFGSVTKEGEEFFFIRDNGVGFDPAYSDKLFKAFDRLHSQKDFKGSGIGLATVKRIVNLHSGKIFAESTPNKGATFYFNLNQP